MIVVAVGFMVRVEGFFPRMTHFLGARIFKGHLSYSFMCLWDQLLQFQEEDWRGFGLGLGFIIDI